MPGLHVDSFAVETAWLHVIGNGKHSSSMRLYAAWAGSDASVVRRTQAARGAARQPAVAYAAYFTVASRLYLLLLGIAGQLMKA